MKIIECAQRSPEWRAARRGVITASEMGMFLTEDPKCRLTKAEMLEVLAESGVVNIPAKAKNEDLESLLPNREQYLSITEKSDSARNALICAKLGEMSGEEIPDFDTFATKRGIELEPLARAAYEEMTGCTVTEVGLILHDSAYQYKANGQILWHGFGCSPDGLIYEPDGRLSHGLEIKCHLPHIHVQHLFANKLPDEHKAQVHGQMAATGVNEWHHYEYCPGLPSLLIVVKRDAFTERLLQGLHEITAELEQKRAQLAKLWDAAFNGKEQTA